MHNVHLVTQEEKRVKTDRKLAECTECTAQGQPRRPGCAPAAQPALPRVLCARPRLLPRPAERAARACLPRACISCRAPRAPAARPLAQRLLRPAATCAPHACYPATSVTIQFLLYRDTTFPSLQYPSNLAIQNLPIAIYSAQLPACNTLVVLQYNFPTTHCPCCNTISLEPATFQPPKFQ